MGRRKGLRGLSKMARVLFKCLEERKWKDAEAAMKKIQTCETNREEEWMRGYTNALHGMLIALRYSHSPPEPLILKIGNRSPSRLKELKRTFYGQSRGRLNADFDRGFFRTWYEYIKFLMDKSPTVRMPETPVMKQTERSLLPGSI